MKNYPHIWQKVFNEPWLVSLSTYDAIRQTLLARMTGKGAEMAPPIVEPKAALFGSDSEESYIVGPNSTAIVPLSGIIGKRLSAMEMLCGGCSLDAARESFQAALADPSVKTVILWGDTPGGTVTGVPEFANMVFDASLHSGKQILGYSDTLCCSAGYYILSQCHEMLAAPSATVGSIGVVITLVDQTAKDANDGLSYTTIKSGAYKDTGNPHRKMESDELAMMQAEVDAIAGEFFGAVNRTRPDVDCVGLGARVLTGEAALEAGLVDSNFDSIDELLAALG